MNKPLVAISHLSVQYDKNEVLSDVSLTIHRNEFLGVIGPNGGGKTTFVRTLLGLISPTNGSISYYNEKGVKTKKRPVMGYLPQYNEIDRTFPISVAEVIQSGLPSSLSATQKRGKIQEILSMMGLESMRKRQINALSGGELQRALLGRALACSPDLLILDEPGTYIDQHYKSVLFAILERVNATCAILLVSHDIGTIMSRVGGVICIDKSVHMHPVDEIDEAVLTKHFGCSIDLLGHGHLPHRVLSEHKK